MRLHGAAARVDRLGLGRGNVLRGRAAVAAPVVQHFGDVFHPLCLFRQAEDEVVVLRAVELAVQLAARSLVQLAAEHGEMRDVVAAAQRIGRVIGFEMILAQFFHRGIEHDLIGIDEVRARLVDRADHLVQRVGRELVVVVEQSEVVARGLAHTDVRVAGNALVGGHLAQYDAAVAEFLDRLGRLVMLRVRPVHEHQLKVGITLVQDALDHILQERDRRIVQRNDHRDQRHQREFILFLHPQIALERNVRTELPALSLCHQIHAVTHLPAGGLKAAVFDA